MEEEEEEIFINVTEILFPSCKREHERNMERDKRERVEEVKERTRRCTNELDYGVFLVVILNRFHITIFIIPRFV